MRVARTRREERLPVVLTREEVRRLCEAMEGTLGLMARLIYGTGMRLMECVRLRAGDLDFGNRAIVVRNSMGGKDRLVPLPERGHADVSTTMIYTHVLNRPGVVPVRSPVDAW